MEPGMGKLIHRVMETKIFENKDVLTDKYIPPGEPIHRNAEVNLVASHLIPALKDQTPRNCFIYGMMGSGKTIVTKYVLREILSKARDLNKNIRSCYINCRFNRVASTIMGEIINGFSPTPQPLGGQVTKKIDKLATIMQKLTGHFIIVLDEADHLGKGRTDQTNLLYILTRLTTTKESFLQDVTVSTVAISNDIKFFESLDGRIQSSFGGEEFIFPPYNSAQLQDILKQRAKNAFKPGVIDDSVIPLCAAFASQEHGDARKAIELLRIAGELAERNEEEKVIEQHVRIARAKHETDRTTEILRTLPIQSKAVILSIILNEENGKDVLTTGEVYDTYRVISKKADIPVLTQRRAADLISSLDTIGLINAHVISYGRGGRTMDIHNSVPIGPAKETLLQDETLSALKNYKPPHPHNRGGKGFF